VPWRRKREQSPALPQSVSISAIRNSAVAVGSGNYTVQGSSVEAGPAIQELGDAIAAVRRLAEIQGETWRSRH
jgi:hypothetical protein